MSSKQQILTNLREEFERWEELLAGLSEEQISAPLPPGGLAIKDEIAHLRAWQQRTIARAEAALLGGEPAFPSWPAGLDPDVEEHTDRINAWIYQAGRARPWPQVHREWREGFLRLLELGEAVAEQDMLEVGRYPWLKSHSLGFILQASCEHHAEHLSELRPRLGQG